MLRVWPLVIGFWRSSSIRTLKTFPHPKPSLWTSHFLTTLIVLPIKVHISSFIQAMGRSCICTPNDFLENFTLEAGVHPSNSIRESRDYSKSHGLQDITQFISSSLAKEKIYGFELNLSTEKGLDVFHFFSIVVLITSLLMDQSTSNFL